MSDGLTDRRSQPDDVITKVRTARNNLMRALAIAQNQGEEIDVRVDANGYIHLKRKIEQWEKL